MKTELDSHLFEAIPCPALIITRGHHLAHCNKPATELFESLQRLDTGSAKLQPQSILLNVAGNELTSFALIPDPTFSFEKQVRAGPPPIHLRITLSRLPPGLDGEPRWLVMLMDVSPQARLSQLLSLTMNEFESRVEDRTMELARANSSLRRALEELRQSAHVLKKLSRVIEQVEEHVVITDASGLIEYVNPAFEKLTGYSRAEAIGRTPRIVKSGQHDAAYIRSLWETISAGHIFKGEFVNKKKDGSYYFEEKTITPIRDEHGHITHYVSTGRPLDARKSAALKLKLAATPAPAETPKKRVKFPKEK